MARYYLIFDRDDVGLREDLQEQMVEVRVCRCGVLVMEGEDVHWQHAHEPEQED